MVDAQQFLAECFARLRDSRAGPVFFIEHGLSEVDTEDLRQAVRRAARHYPLQSDWWRTNPLPLVVTATEIGYRYRGTGTDFWPKLESALGIRISPESRQEVRDLFKKCSSKYRGARPPVTPWTRYFCLIAWPVTHALVPLEFHRQLSATLANLRSDVEALDDEELHRAVRIAARQPSARFESFLEDGSHAVPVIRALLGGQGGEVSQDTVTRIDLDLKADRDTRIDIEIARRKQRRLRTRPASPHKPTVREVLPGPPPTAAPRRRRTGRRSRVSGHSGPRSGSTAPDPSETPPTDPAMGRDLPGSERLLAVRTAIPREPARGAGRRHAAPGGAGSTRN